MSLLKIFSLIRRKIATHIFNTVQDYFQTDYVKISIEIIETYCLFMDIDHYLDFISKIDVHSNFENYLLICLNLINRKRYYQ